MTQNRFRLAAPAGFAATLLLCAAALNGAAAGPFGAAESAAIPGGGSGSFVQLKQISGFTGQMALSHSDGGYAPVGSSFNKLIKLRMRVDCPASYRVHEAGIRVRGDDVYNYNVELVSPGDVPYDQNSWQQMLEQEPWDFDAVVAVGGEALDAAGNNGPVYVSLNEVLDSRTEFYGSCSPSEPSSGLPFLYYDSAEDDGHLRPMTRVRFEVKHSTIARDRRQLKAGAPVATAARVPERLRHRDRALSSSTAVPPAGPRLKAPGGCPYDCPPPALSRQLRN